ncbi:unnamed protein product [Porites lobata]|uniref:MARVEL domain-containing protein n=1 Tax=Porites lobata TaxID=104759 RepID=A0ABN8QBJ4_9CNID|nr:unnamed protein product [Porites lobata]
MADPENQGANPDKAPEKQSSGGGGQIGFTMEYVTSIPGIIKIVEFFLLMIAFALAADFKGSFSWGRMDFFLFVTITSWLFVIAIFVLFVFNVISVINVNIDWNLPVMIFAGVVAVLLLISSSLIADDARRGNDIYGGLRPYGYSVDKLSAAAAFGFFSMVAFIIDAGIHFMKMQGRIQPALSCEHIENFTKDLEMADPENQGANPDKAPEKQSSGGGEQIGFIMEYITSIPGIIKIVQFFLLMIAFGLAAGSKGSFSWGRMDFFLFVTITSWVLVIAIFVLFAFNVISMINVNIDWKLPVMIFDAVVAVLLLISSSLIADDARKWNYIYGGLRPYGFSVDKLSAAAAFGFFSMVAFIIDAVIHFMKMQGKM